MSSSTLQDRVLGCITGGAIGDAFGAPYEGLRPPFQIKFGSQLRLSDDTQLTLATCAAIADSGCVDPAVIAKTFAAWHKESRFTGLGASTYKALAELAHGGHWALVGRRGEMAAGNGAAMRVAPLAFCLDPGDREARRTIRDVCRITHHNEEAYAGALAVLIAVRYAWTGEWSGTGNLSAMAARLLPDSTTRDRLIEIGEMGVSVSLAEIARRFGSSGYVAESVPLAIRGAERVATLGFESMIGELIAAGGDTDTIASMSGQIAGALLGESTLPRQMTARLPEASLVAAVGIRFSQAVDRMRERATGSRAADKQGDAEDKA